MQIQAGGLFILVAGWQPQWLLVPTLELRVAGTKAGGLFFDLLVLQYLSCASVGSSLKDWLVGCTTQSILFLSAHHPLTLTPLLWKHFDLCSGLICRKLQLTDFGEEVERDQVHKIKPQMYPSILLSISSCLFFASLPPLCHHLPQLPSLLSFFILQLESLENTWFYAHAHWLSGSKRAWLLWSPQLSPNTTA